MDGAQARTILEPRPAITGGYKRLGGDLQVPAEVGWEEFWVGTAKYLGWQHCKISLCLKYEKRAKYLGVKNKPYR